MTYPANRRDGRVLESLKKCAASAEQSGGGRWGFALVNGKSFAVTARAVDEWLLLELPLTDRIARGEMWDLLRMNACLEGSSKFVLMPDNRSVHLRADIPLFDEEYDQTECDGETDEDLARRVETACAGLKGALHSFRGEATNGRAMKSGQTEGADESRAQELQRLCAEAGWPFIERAAGRLAIDLDARGGFYQALVEQRGWGARVSVEVAVCDDLSATSRQAITTLLLKTGGVVRLARPSVDEQESRIAARFEVAFVALPTALELAHALSSLSVACSLCGRETRVLRDETIANDYLAIAGIAAGSAEVREEAMRSAAD